LERSNIIIVHNYNTHNTNTWKPKLSIRVYEDQPKLLFFRNSTKISTITTTCHLPLLCFIPAQREMLSLLGLKVNLVLLMNLVSHHRPLSFINQYVRDIDHFDETDSFSSFFELQCILYFGSLIIMRLPRSTAFHFTFNSSQACLIDSRSTLYYEC
jgi:hypothetical protein